jgi:hypothetical protein
VPVFVFSLLMAMISIAGTVLIILVIARAVTRSAEIRQETYMKTLQSGIYDYRLTGRTPSSGTATLGWGIFFSSVGLALFISFIALGIIRDALAGALVPFFIGAGLIIYYFIRKRIVGDVKANGEPVRFSASDGSEPPRVADE